jgi:hypothetical protein
VTVKDVEKIEKSISDGINFKKPPEKLEMLTLAIGDNKWLQLS